MLRFVRYIVVAAVVLLSGTAARAQFSIEDYDRWQVYNGWRIWVIELPGIHNFGRSDLLTVMATEQPSWSRRYVRIGRRTMFYADNFAADLFRVRNFYRREGFPHAEVHGYVFPDEKHKEVKLKIEISEGPPLILESWRMVFGSDSGAGVDSARWSRSLAVKIGKPLALSDLQSSADTLAHKLRVIGHARARVEFQVLADSLRNTAAATFILYPGRFCYLGATRITGLKQVTESTARRELAYCKFDPFSSTKLEKTRRQLVKLETFSHVSVKPDTATPGDTLAVYIKTDEGRRYHVRLGGGYDTDVGRRASADFTDLNFFGRGRRFTWSGSYADIYRATEARLFWPHTPLNAIDITVAPKWDYKEEPGYRLETVSGTTIFSSEPLDYVNISVSNEVGVARRKDVISGEKTRYTKSVETFSIGWDTRDHPLVPRKGHFVGMTLAESGAIYRTDLRWWRAIFTGRVLVPATRFTILAGKTEFGIMGPLHDAHTTPIEERFYLGGPTTVRGWRRNHLSPRGVDAERTPVGGDFSLSLTTEIRYNIWGPITAAAFCDAGNVWKNKEVWKPFDLYPSAGAGVLFVTMLGPIRLDYAFQLRPNPYHDKSSAIHFSLGTPF